jgi:hypothetical protein
MLSRVETGAGRERTLTGITGALNFMAFLRHFLEQYR